MKPFREQMEECRRNGNLILADITQADLWQNIRSPFPQHKPYKQTVLSICIRHKCSCYSGACKIERMEGD